MPCSREFTIAFFVTGITAKQHRNFAIGEREHWQYLQRSDVTGGLEQSLYIGESRKASQRYIGWWQNAQLSRLMLVQRILNTNPNRIMNLATVDNDLSSLCSGAA